MVKLAGLENRAPSQARGFEPLPLRQQRDVASGGPAVPSGARARDLGEQPDSDRSTVPAWRGLAPADTPADRRSGPVSVSGQSSLRGTESLKSS